MAFTIIAGLGTANFLYQAMTDQSWLTALERSAFQAIAVLTYVAFVRLHKAGSAK
jgi:hypothetical protein